MTVGVGGAAEGVAGAEVAGDGGGPDVVDVADVGEVGEVGDVGDVGDVGTDGEVVSGGVVSVVVGVVDIRSLWTSVLGTQVYDGSGMKPGGTTWVAGGDSAGGR